MLTAVQFDDQLLFDATEIGNIRANRMSLAPPARVGVSAEIDAQLVIPQLSPQFALGGSQVVA